MKKSKILFMILALVFVLSIVSCGGKKPPLEGTEVTDPIETEPPAPTYDMTLLGNWLDYTLVFPEGT